jgi:hypothetical protein
LDGKAQFIAARQKFTPNVALEPRDQRDNVRMSTAILSIALLRSYFHAPGSALVSIYILRFKFSRACVRSVFRLSRDHHCGAYGCSGVNVRTLVVRRSLSRSWTRRQLS